MHYIRYACKIEKMNFAFAQGVCKLLQPIVLQYYMSGTCIIFIEGNDIFDKEETISNGLHIEENVL